MSARRRSSAVTAQTVVQACRVGADDWLFGELTGWTEAMPRRSVTAWVRVGLFATGACIGALGMWVVVGVSGNPLPDVLHLTPVWSNPADLYEPGPVVGIRGSLVEDVPWASAPDTFETTRYWAEYVGTFSYAGVDFTWLVGDLRGHCQGLRWSNLTIPQGLEVGEGPCRSPIDASSALADVERRFWIEMAPHVAGLHSGEVAPSGSSAGASGS